MNKIINKLWDYEDGFKFWLRFLKNRKNQINDPKYSKKVSSFILSLYSNDKSKLLKISSFFKYLKAKFEEPIIDIYEYDTEYSINISINLKKMINSFFINDFLIDDYFKQLNKISSSIVSYHNIEGYEIKKRHKNIVSLKFTHYEPLLEESGIKETIIDFFHEIKENKRLHINEENEIIKWLNYYYLNKNTVNNNIKKVVTKI